MDGLRKRLVWLAVMIPLAGAVAACEEGPAEQAGEAIDDAGREVGDAVDDATD